MEELIENILQSGNPNKQQIGYLISKSNELNLKKDECFSEAGKIPRQVSSVVEGIMRGC